MFCNNALLYIYVCPDFLFFFCSVLSKKLLRGMCRRIAYFFFFLLDDTIVVYATAANESDLLLVFSLNQSKSRLSFFEKHRICPRKVSITTVCIATIIASSFVILTNT